MTRFLNQLCTEELRSASFFAAYESNANTCNLNAMGEQFAETFLAGGPQGSRAVRREDFLAFLPKRQQMLAAMGLRDAWLTALRETPVGPAHLLAETKWRMEMAGGDAPEPPIQETPIEAAPIEVTSTFLLERHGESWRILFYLAHNDLAALVRERQGAASDRTAAGGAASDCPVAESKVD